MPIEILRRRVVSSSAAGKVNESYLLVMFVSGKFVSCVRDARQHHARALTRNSTSDDCGANATFFGNRIRFVRIHHCQGGAVVNTAFGRAGESWLACRPLLGSPFCRHWASIAHAPSFRRRVRQVRTSAARNPMLRGYLTPSFASLRRSRRSWKVKRRGLRRHFRTGVVPLKFASASAMSSA